MTMAKLITDVHLTPRSVCHESLAHLWTRKTRKREGRRRINSLTKKSQKQKRVLSQLRLQNEKCR